MMIDMFEAFFWAETRVDIEYYSEKSLRVLSASRRRRNDGLQNQISARSPSAQIMMPWRRRFILATSKRQ